MLFAIFSTVVIFLNMYLTASSPVRRTRIVPIMTTSDPLSQFLNIS